MGTDIHGVFQKFDGSKWIDIASKYEFNRHYQLFAVLADVRNGVGFAGCRTGEVVVPISEPRGLPEDFSEDEDNWMGDHSFSWLTGKEILKYASKNKSKVVTKIGYISRQQYENWDKQSEPETYCGDTWGSEIIKIDDNDFSKVLEPNWTHINVKWKQGLLEELNYFFEEIQRLVDEHGEIRFVFGFDS